MDIMPPDNQLPPHHAPTGLKLWLTIFGVVLVIALSYLVWVQNTAPDTTDNSTVVTTTSTPSTSSTTTPSTSTTSTDATAEWITYTSVALGFSIKYPKDWELAVETAEFLSISDSTKYCDPGSLGLEKSSPGDLDLFIGVCTKDSVAAERNKIEGESGTINLGGKTAVAYKAYVNDTTLATYPHYYAIYDYSNVRSFKISIAADAENLATVDKIIKSITFAK